MNRAERRRMDRGGVFKGWVIHPSPKQLKVGNGWVGELEKVYRSDDNKYAVMVRRVETEWGTVEHACIRNRDNTDIPWSEKQRIKNELFGVDRIAVEVFPEESNLIDQANMYHLWILPRGMELPFGLHK